MTWTDERCDTLRALWTEGLSAGQIAAELGDVTRNAVIGKAHRLGLDGRNARSNPRVKEIGKAENVSASRAVLRCNEQLTELRTDNVVFDGNPITLLELSNHSCRWPVNENVRNMLYCGKPEADMDCHKPYCDHHTQIAWRS